MNEPTIQTLSHNSTVILGDCMDGMREYPDKYFDLAVVDPPYGIGADNHSGNKSNGWTQWRKKSWDVSAPNIEYFDLLFRVSRHQIIWGANHFIDLLPYRFSCFLIWDKGQRDFSLADGEMAWTSLSGAARFYTFSRALANREDKIHPTQKPVALYDWIYKNYLPDGGKVIDTHLGSGSNRIAAHKAGNIEFVGYEIDPEYYEAQEKRWRGYVSQLKLF